MILRVWRLTHLYYHLNGFLLVFLSVNFGHNRAIVAEDYSSSFEA